MIQPNKENLLLVLNQIKEHPETWDQRVWHCDTSHCFAGWAQVLAGQDADDNTVRRDARQFCGLNKAQADYLFSRDRTLDEIESYVAFLLDDSRAYDRTGFDRDGRDHNGLDRDGFDIDGFNADGLDDDGLDRNNNSRPVAA